MWLILSLSCALSNAVSACLSKSLLKRNNEYLVAWLRLAIGAPLLLSVLFFIKMPVLGPLFYRTVLILLPIEVAAYILHIKALKYSPLSLTLPFLALTPLLLIFSGHVILGESISSLGVLGILLVVSGIYLLNVNDLRLGLLAPLRSILKEKGSVYMIIVAFLYSLSAVLGKLAVRQSSPLFFSAVYYPILFVGLLPVMAFKRKATLSMRSISSSDKLFFLGAGLVLAISAMLHFSAVSVTKVAYMVTIKRLSMVFGIILGWIFFKETYILNRLLASLVIVLGIFIIAIA